MPDSLQTIAADVRGCLKCPLSATRTLAVPGEGSPNAEVLFLGEGPGFHEDQQGRPFVGAAGQLLTDSLRQIGLRREEVFITNVVRCRPPGNRDPLPEELSACNDYTERQVAALQPRLIVTLGRFSMARFFRPGPMRELHGTTTTWQRTTCLAMYHPAAILRTNTPEMRQVFAADFRKIPLLLAEARNAIALARAAEKAALEAASVVRLDQLPLL